MAAVVIVVIHVRAVDVVKMPHMYHWHVCGSLESRPFSIRLFPTGWQGPVIRGSPYLDIRRKALLKVPNTWK